MGLRNRLELESAVEGNEDGIATNKDLEPVPLDSPMRTWTWPR